ncbi:MAG: AmmeMemoRadiSam system protein B [Ignavibacteriales bacterium CG_4_9_14_3_um_filter_34_10]|nr:MAG: AmmeMemoRadiSam system protein B [Ignavibacteriales bacterium CG_4_9_14_3_um_filter_34_10]
MNEIIRKPAVAGLFYPKNADALKSMITDLLSKTKSEINGENIFGLVSPHAGYIYSGYTAAFAYNVLSEKEFTTAIILSPSHHDYFQGISVYSGDFYETPLGKVAVDKDLRTLFLNNSKNIYSADIGHRAEHAIEVQIPFLQIIKGNFKILPVVIGDQRRKYLDELSAKIAECYSPETVIIASSDLSHFYNKEMAGKLDELVEERIRDFDFEELQADFENQNCEACGGGAIVSLMKAANLKGFTKSKILSRTDSGDFSGDNTSVVGYLSAVIYN